ncbi:MAG: hypothetical protein J7497_03350 [Chitinophagaceae bacterium]|nr:hypothetical protein [Chitinophagaceae bacterium]
MSQPRVPKNFDFNEKVDKSFIFSLYEQDFVYITEVFGSSLESLDTDVEDLESSFRGGNLVELRKAVHKLKPIFGFTGLLDHQEKIGLFEQQAAMAGNTDAVSHEFDELMKVIRDGKRIIEDEHRRLTDFI